MTGTEMGTQEKKEGQHGDKGRGVKRRGGGGGWGGGVAPCSLPWSPHDASHPTRIPQVVIAASLTPPGGTPHEIGTGWACLISVSSSSSSSSWRLHQLWLGCTVQCYFCLYVILSRNCFVYRRWTFNLAVLPYFSLLFCLMTLKWV